MPIVMRLRAPVTWPFHLQKTYSEEGKELNSKTATTPSLASDNQLRHSAATDIRKHFGIEACPEQCSGMPRLAATQIYAEKNVDAAKRIAAALG